MKNELLFLLSDCNNTLEKELINFLGKKAEAVGSTIKHQVFKAALLSEKDILKHFDITDIEKTFDTFKNEFIEVLNDNIDILGSSWTTDLYICGEYIPLLNNKVEVEKLELEDKKAIIKFKILFFLDEFKTVIKSYEK